MSMSFSGGGERVIPVLRIRGVLSVRGGNTIETIGPLIDRGMALAGRGGVVIVDIESAGGSPVQAELIAARLRLGAAAHDVRVTALIGEVCAAGAYWVACAADEIVAHAMSVVGLNGVIEVSGLLDGAGVSPVEPPHARRLIEDLQEQFRVWVQTRRGARLELDAEPVFAGSLVLGDQAVSVGLADRIGDLETLVAECGAGARAEILARSPDR